MSARHILIHVCKVIFLCACTTAGASHDYTTGMTEGYCLESKEQADLRKKIKSKGFVRVSRRIFVGEVLSEDAIDRNIEQFSETKEKVYRVRVLENWKGVGEDVISIIGIEVTTEEEFYKHVDDWHSWQRQPLVKGSMNTEFTRDGWAIPIKNGSKNDSGDPVCVYRPPLFIGEKFLFMITDPYTSRVAEPLLGNNSLWFEEVKSALDKN